MSGQITLLLAVHCHQPVGNFDFILERAYREAYEPFLSVIERHPAVKLSLHYSGCLLDWLAMRHPGFIQRIRDLVSRGQAELLSSGYYEPILPVIPEQDRQGQLALMRRRLHDTFGQEPSGAWLTERVWEPDLPRTLSTAGVRYTILDTNQFQTARPLLPRVLQAQDGHFWDLLGCYTAEYGEWQTIVFPASNRLRYWIPFQPVPQTMNWLRRLANRLDRPVALTFADDGEKFGLWPKTHEWVYQAGWLERFCQALEREQAWLRTMTCQAYLESMGPEGSVAIPSGSYKELLEWSGGHFRNFFIKYPEANAMHRKMLKVSRRLQVWMAHHAPHTEGNGYALEHGTRDTMLDRAEEARQHVYKAQCNCAYWHGIFGGLYLGHLRRAIYHHLIAADGILNHLHDEPTAYDQVEEDGAGHAAIAVTTPAMHLQIHPHNGGTITEWSLFQSRLNVLDTLTRREEPYHATIRRGRRRRGAKSMRLHVLLGEKDSNLGSSLAYDRTPRVSFFDTGLDRLPTLREQLTGAWAIRRRWESGAFEPQVTHTDEAIDVRLVRRIGQGFVRKSITVWTQQPIVECQYELVDCPAAAVTLAFNLSLRDERWLRAGEQRQAHSFNVREPSAGIMLQVSCEPASLIQHAPIETVSESEGGLERTYQGLGLTFGWVVSTPHAWSCRVRWLVEESPPSCERPDAAGGAAEGMASCASGRWPTTHHGGVA